MTETTSAAPLGTQRGILFGIVAFIGTLGVYGVYWTYKTFEELKRHTGRGIGGLVALLPFLAFFVPMFEPVGMLPVYLAPREIGQMYARAGKEPPVSGWTGLWWFPGIAIVVGPFIWFAKVQGALNRYWEAEPVLPADVLVAARPLVESAPRESSNLGVALGLLVLAPLSWIFVCGGLVVMMALPNNGITPSDLGLALFLVVPAVLWLIALAVTLWGWRPSGHFADESAWSVAAAWWVVSAVSAYILLFSA